MGDIQYNVKEFVIDAHDCSLQLKRSDVAEKSVIVLREAAERVGATVLNVYTTPYAKHGFTTVALLAESHIILTAWPEYNYASINIYLCNSLMDHKLVKERIFEFLQPSNWKSSWFRHVPLPTGHARIFLAAPFTRYLKEGRNVFCESAYTKITQCLTLLRGHGCSVFSAHEREDFGRDLMSPSLCTRLDFEEMVQSDLMVALMDNDSFGVCVELGWASALNKPIILVIPDGKSFVSPLVEGIGQISKMSVVSSVSDVITTIGNLQCKTLITT